MATESAEQFELSHSAAPLRELLAGLRADEAWRRGLAALQRGEVASFDNVWGGSRALLAAALHAASPAGLILVAASNRVADEWADELALFTDARLRRFPAWSDQHDGRAAREMEFGQRLATLKQLGGLKTSPGIILTSIQGLMQKTPSAREVRAAARHLAIGDRVDPAELKRWLAQVGYQAASAVELPGEFAARGGLLDVFALDWEYPVRIEFFDTEIESLRQFDAGNQRSVDNLRTIEVCTAGALEANEHFLDQVPPQSWIVLLELEQITESGRVFLERAELPQQLFSVTDTLARVHRFTWSSAAALALFAGQETQRLDIESIEKFSGEIGRVRQELDGVGGSSRISLVAQTDAEAQRRHELLADSAALREGRLNFVCGFLYQGFRLRQAGAVVLSCRELLAQDQIARRVASRAAPAQPLEGFRDLREGELVVHLAHGIGRYRGLKQLEQEGRVADYLAIEFHAGTTIYVPTARIDLVQRYVGGTKDKPVLARIGGKSWLKQKSAAQAAATDIAADMLQLQAVRASRPGVTCGRDSEWQREFDAAFPYHETPDQLRAIVAIKVDMEGVRPMDRLLCGDVGYGKTEVAMRAIFKAIDNGYQTALMAPTTILAEQHFHSIRDRMAAFPIDVGKLSRFCSTAQQKMTIEGIRAGKIDVVVGTHRLASRDVQFQNLGLVIIDEEQRFGVDVKERLKAIRSSVDVLTMSATPIPRTLHMALVGVRDISNLETPPEDRLPVETRITRFDDDLIRRAILRELSRGGQIYFVHNRIDDIQLIAERLRGIAPEARIGIAHGQLPEEVLERVMVSFVHGEFDLLLATTIVESGLDIPTANTIFIDQADRYGLADLHQLRGRVGRFKHRAYCYLLLDPRRHITPNAGRRLRAIEEYSDMGAGFAISMRDLEIRGAGNLLGAQQSGHIAAVGYEFYCQLLENAVRQQKALPPRLSWDIEIDLPGEMYLPDEYIQDIRLKIDLYRRMAKLEGFEALAEMERLRDRFGTLPTSARRMLEVTSLKLMAAIWQISAIYTEPGFLVFRFVSLARMKQLQRTAPVQIRIADAKSAYVPTTAALTAEPDGLLQFAKSVLQC